MSIQSHPSPTVLQDLTVSLATAEQSFGADSEEATRLLRSLLLFHTQSGNSREGLSCALKLRGHFEKPSAVKGVEYQALLWHLARLYAHEGRWDEAATEYAGLIAIKSESEDIPGELQATLQLARCYIQTKQYREAAILLNEYIKRDGPLLAQAYAYLAQACSHFDQKQAQAALAMEQETIEDRGPDPYELFDENAIPSLSLLGGLAESAFSTCE